MQTPIEYKVKTIKSKHLRLNDLKLEATDSYLYKKYLYKEDIPKYPQPEFHVSHLKHDTHLSGLTGIKTDGGFKYLKNTLRDPCSLPLVWWSLAVGPKDIQSAEARLLEKIYPKRTKEQAEKQKSFLYKFATSPALSSASRYGSYRFTFPLEDVLSAYSQQFCSGAPPVMRVFKTSLFRQEVEYAVLVHSPANQEHFSEYPFLPDDDLNAVCTYRDGCFIWRSEAMCETHSHELIERPEENLMTTEAVSWRPPFYVWDHVVIALHMENEQVLKFDANQLRKNLTFCDKDKVNLPLKLHFNEFQDAKRHVKNLWPESAPLEKEQSFTANEPEEEPMESEDSQK
ncbi:uncharacterized protein LOC115792580 [Archocentrus centrarchus]|uniref:uncharacterized protein LOC115792580 n=1 Tax=Archocentrus centrarchus TaxID=63155 RepID=UPI0011E9E169|nr:uncharacterized protein LOC115792580 [Archocentrus centrarchus]